MALERRGFTLVEVMVVVAIVGLVASIAIPSLVKARRESRISAFANDLRLALDAFELYAIERGGYPADVNRGVVPPGMAEYLPDMDWTAATPLGGNWDWERNAVGISAGISAVGNDLVAEDFLDVDRKIDDGNLSTGRFRDLGGKRYAYVIVD